MQAQQLLKELEVKKEKGTFWQKWWVKIAIKLIKEILEEKTAKK